MLTDYHTAYYAHELTRRCPSDSIEKLGASLFNAKVDLNPHQLDAALFAFRSPLSRGAILADEVGLGKTIEAGIIISQLWAERKRRILAITPTILRKQWQQELVDKFYLPSKVFDAREYNASARAGPRLPMEVKDQVVICSYHFARSKSAEIRAIPWDLVVIDEAHRLRNVWRPGNKIAAAVKEAVCGRPLLLLTATPLQNSLLELYGLVGVLDEHLFGDLEAFRARYMRGPVEGRELRELKRRLSPVCQRTLRRQVQEYVRFTNRIPITQDFTPTQEESRLYDLVSSYLQRETLFALPTSQRALMTMVLRKLLASSTFAIAATLASLARKLQQRHGDLLAGLEEDFEGLDEIADEWAEVNAATTTEDAAEPSPEALRKEVDDLLGYGDLASAITVNAKGQALLTALAQGFAKLAELEAAQKAVIFTESCRTQDYLLRLLTRNGYEGRVLTINGTNADDRSGAIYRAWRQRHAGDPVVTGNKTVDLRAALVEEFRDRADILISTEAAAEGVNLQFCSLVVNYDLPWNPQRIEQRIGRCHRYGQAHDVVVINFLNRTNQADQRVFELLSEKFRLFEGVFGSSDEVLGALESGVDFERRIADIYQSCRTAEEIDTAFNALRGELEEQIAARMADTRKALLENFDEEVHQRLRVSLEGSRALLGRLERCLWNLTRHELQGCARFFEETCEFDLLCTGDGLPEVPPGRYQFVTHMKEADGRYPYRPGHPLAEALVQRAKERPLAPASVTFDLSGYRSRIGLLDPMVGRSGWLSLSKLTVSSLESEDRLLFAGMDDQGHPLHPDACARLFLLDGRVDGPVAVPAEVEEELARQTQTRQAEALAAIAERNGRFFDEEIEKLERWADDLKHGLEVELKDLEAQLRQTRKDARLQADLASKLAAHRAIKDLEAERARKRRQLYEAQDDVDARKEGLISEVEARLHPHEHMESAIVLRWSVA
ncbi:MAG TPA: SNF2-related protein [Chthonomonadales bacterium]|nr:SNF2-related protein [Chthonomonadales bacterium]